MKKSEIGKVLAEHPDAVFATTHEFPIYLTQVQFLTPPRQRSRLVGKAINTYKDPPEVGDYWSTYPFHQIVSVYANTTEEAIAKLTEAKAAEELADVAKADAYKRSAALADTLTGLFVDADMNSAYVRTGWGVPDVTIDLSNDDVSKLIALLGGEQ